MDSARDTPSERESEGEMEWRREGKRAKITFHFNQFQFCRSWLWFPTKLAKCTANWHESVLVGAKLNLLWILGNARNAIRMTASSRICVQISTSKLTFPPGDPATPGGPIAPVSPTGPGGPGGPAIPQTQTISWSQINRKIYHLNVFTWSTVMSRNASNTWAKTAKRYLHNIKLFVCLFALMDFHVCSCVWPITHFFQLIVFPLDKSRKHHSRWCINWIVCFGIRLWCGCSCFFFLSSSSSSSSLLLSHFDIGMRTAIVFNLLPSLSRWTRRMAAIFGYHFKLHIEWNEMNGNVHGTGLHTQSPGRPQQKRTFNNQTRAFSFILFFAGLLFFAHSASYMLACLPALHRIPFNVICKFHFYFKSFNKIIFV